MVGVRHPREQQQQPPDIQVPFMILIFLVFFSLVIYVATVPDFDDIDPNKPLPSLQEMKEEVIKHHQFKQVAQQAEQRLRSTVFQKRQQISKALDTLTTSSIPARLKLLRDKNQIVGENLIDITSGKETVHELLHGGSTMTGGNAGGNDGTNDRPPMTLDEIIDYIQNWLHELHDVLASHKRAPHEQIWQLYHDLTVKTLYVWDREYLSRKPPRREDGSRFLSLSTYSDENCFNTVQQAYEKAQNPDKLFIGLVQQNCHDDCRSGILEGGKTESVEPDQNCYQAYCETPEGADKCANGQIRLIDIDEPESLGPYAARFFASKVRKEKKKIR